MDVVGVDGDGDDNVGVDSVVNYFYDFIIHQNCARSSFFPESSNTLLYEMSWILKIWRTMNTWWDCCCPSLSKFSFSTANRFDLLLPQMKEFRLLCQWLNIGFSRKPSGFDHSSWPGRIECEAPWASDWKDLISIPIEKICWHYWTNLTHFWMCSLASPAGAGVEGGSALLLGSWDTI